MLNTDRVRLMSQMALIERKSGKKISRMINFTRRDYIGRAVLFSFISTTIVSLGLIGLAAAYLFLYRLDDLITDLTYFIVVAIVAYAVFLYVRLMAAGHRAAREYKEGYEQLAALRDDMGDLRQLYEDEARQTRSMAAVTEARPAGSMKPAQAKNGGKND